MQQLEPIFFSEEDSNIEKADKSAQVERNDESRGTDIFSQK